MLSDDWRASHLVRQNEGVAEADRRHVEERDMARAQRDAAVARILQLQDQVEQFQRSHADAMAETSRVQVAEREAATARIRRLVARLKGFIAEPPAQDGNIVRK